MFRLDQDIRTLYRRTVQRSRFEALINDFASCQEGLDAWTKRLYELERSVGGIGAHNVNTLLVDEESKNPAIIGTYQSEDRDVFRPIQYCAVLLLSQFVALDTRYLVDNGCGHVESALKRILASLTGKSVIERSMGVVLRDLTKRTELEDDAEMLEVSRSINTVYRRAKHEFATSPSTEAVPISSSSDLGNHLFTYEEAVITYFGCRIHGLELMEWMKDRGIAPASTMGLPHSSWEVYVAVAAQLSSNLRRWQPELVHGGRASSGSPP